jgi:hypothetical protein
MLKYFKFSLGTTIHVLNQDFGHDFKLLITDSVPLVSSLTFHITFNLIFQLLSTILAISDSQQLNPNMLSNS